MFKGIFFFCGSYVAALFYLSQNNWLNECGRGILASVLNKLETISHVFLDCCLACIAWLAVYLAFNISQHGSIWSWLGFGSGGE